MAHYAFLDDNNIVVKVLPGKDENTDGVDWEEYYGNFTGLTCKRTSYNTFGNQHNLDGTPYRGNYAGIGYTYDEVNDVFIAPQPIIEGKTFELNQTTWLWEEVIE
jgi:hypothetical protein